MKICPLCRSTYRDEMQFCPADGKELSPYTEHKNVYPGQIIEDKYMVEQEIDNSGKWSVYQGTTISTGQKVVVKVMPVPNTWQFQEILKFRNHMKNLKQKNHPGLVSILDYGVIQDDFLYVVLEYIEGQTLKKLLEDVGAFSLSLTISVLEQMLMVLEFLHNKDILHLALSTSKVFLLEAPGSTHFVKIDSVGYPIPIYSAATATPHNLVLHSGTDYTAPELFYGQKPDSRSDIYSVGVILYEMVTGMLPFPHKAWLSQASEHIPVVAPRLVKPAVKIPRSFERMMLKAIKWIPDRRFSNVSAFLATLEKSKHRWSWKILPVAGVLLLVLAMWASFTLLVMGQSPWQYCKNFFYQAVYRKNIPENAPVTTRANLTKAQQSLQQYEKELALIQNKAAQRPPCENVDMIYIPEGITIIADWSNDADEPTIRMETLPAFYIDRTEVTNARYLAFVQDTGHTPPPYWIKDNYPQGQQDYPVVEVSWYDATLYARWEGKRLPLEAEWERAARGEIKSSASVSYKDLRQWPWGNIFISDYANVGGDTLLPVGQFVKGKSPFGIWDMAGNVWEWTDSWYHSNAPEDRVIRGGSFLSTPEQAKISYRDGFFADSHRHDIGFRCVRDAK